MSAKPPGAAVTGQAPVNAIDDSQDIGATAAASSGAAVVLPQHATPKHIAIIMDGNNRWARKRLLPGIGGHKAGVEAIRNVLTVCEKYQVKVLTLFAFSSENWQRPEEEVGALMRLFLAYLKREVNDLHNKGIRLRFIGKRDRLSAEIVEQMEIAEQLTKNNTVSTLVLAVDYGGQWDLANASRRIAQQYSEGKLSLEQIDEVLLDQHTALSDLPKPDLCIRTGGEFRISNFLLWQMAYAELYFTDCYWPDFKEQQMEEAIAAYASRQRRFGMTSEQISSAAAESTDQDNQNNNNPGKQSAD